jgi:hypothetical protein
MTAPEQNTAHGISDGCGNRFILLPCAHQRWAIVDREFSYGVVLFCPGPEQAEPILAALNKDLPSGIRRALGSILISKERA